MKQFNVRSTFVIVYVTISIATFYHSMWGFATLSGLTPDGPLTAAAWWFIGGLMAVAVDAGMGAIVYALVSGWRARWLTAALVVLAVASAYTQIIYAAAHAAQFPLGAVPAWLDWLQYPLDARVVLLPLMLPGFALVYAFASKADQANPLEGALKQARETVSDLARKLKERDAELKAIEQAAIASANQVQEAERQAAHRDKQNQTVIDDLKNDIVGLQRQIAELKKAAMDEQQRALFNGDIEKKIKAMQNLWPGLTQTAIAQALDTNNSKVSRVLKNGKS